MTYTLKYRFVFLAGMLVMAIMSSFWLVNSPVFQENESTLSMALTFDLTLTLPLVYFLLIRKTNVPKFTVIPVFVLSFVWASFIIPEQHHTYLDIIEYLVVPLELFIFGFFIYKVHQISKAQKESEVSRLDFVESLRSILLKYLGNKRVSNVAATEISMFHYALMGWGKKKEIDDRPYFTYYKEAGYSQLMGVFVFVIILETVALHLLLDSWSALAAWILTGLSIYSLIFLIGDFNAIRKRPIYFDDEFFYLRIGFRWYAKIPLAEIETVEFNRRPPETKDNANMILIGGPNILMTFSKAQKAIGLYGLSKTFKSLSMNIDDKQGFKAFIDSKKEETRDQE